MRINIRWRFHNSLQYYLPAPIGTFDVYDLAFGLGSHFSSSFEALRTAICVDPADDVFMGLDEARVQVVAPVAVGAFRNNSICT